VSPSRSAQRCAAIVVLASMAVALVAGPASASGTTWWVDDDGKAGPSSCSGTGSAHHHIQTAIDAAGANDTVKVCDGNYTEQVTISGSRDGLTVTSVNSHGAVIKAAAEQTLNTLTLVTITSVDDVTVSDFSIRPRRADTSEECDWSNGIVATDSKDLSITGNQITPIGSGPFCGVADGINVSGGSTGTISDNSVTDYREEGIQLSGVGTDVSVDDNTVTFAQVGLDPAGGAAIRVDTGAKGHIHTNTVNGPASGPGSPAMPGAGVEFHDSADDSTIIGNTIARTAAGIEIDGASGGIVKDNKVTGGQTAYDLFDGDDMSIHDNTTTQATFHGLAVGAGSHRDNVHDNDFRSNKNLTAKDCKGESGTGSHNTWTNNLGNSSNPAVLCTGLHPAVH
jgi:parallel beta-helix repeat protein